MNINLAPICWMHKEQLVNPKTCVIWPCESGFASGRLCRWCSKYRGSERINPLSAKKKPTRTMSNIDEVNEFKATAHEQKLIRQAVALLKNLPSVKEIVLEVSADNLRYLIQDLKEDATHD